MRVLHRRADLPEQLQPRGGIEPARLAVLHDGLALDVLHGEVRQTVGRRPAVEEAGDVRVLEAGEDLTLVAEAADDGIGVHAAFEDLDGDALLVRVVAADGQIDRPHAATSQLATQTIRPDPGACCF